MKAPTVPLEVLIVEDSETDTKLLLRELRRCGYVPNWERVETAPALRAALQQRTWDVVISDSSAPRLDSLQALSLARELLPGIPFIVLSGSGSKEAAARALRSGAADYLNKDELPRLARILVRELPQWGLQHGAAQKAVGMRAAQAKAKAEDAERRRIARELHDQVGQMLTAVGLNLELAQREAGPRRETAMAEALMLLRQAVEQVRDFSLELWPTILDELGLPAALRWLAARQKRWSGFEFQLDLDAPGKLALEVEAAAFRIAQEALTNVARHAKARKVEIRLRRSRAKLELLVRDDGRGFDVAAARRRADAGASLGLAGMQERAALAGGRLEIESADGKGTAVRALFALRARRAP